MNIKKQLIVYFSLVLAISWGVIAFWVWHETNEQMEIIQNPDLRDVEKLTMIQFEIKEIFTAITLPIFVILFTVGIIVVFVINRFLKPFLSLAEELENHSELYLSPIEISSTSKEFSIIVDRLNQLLKRVAQRIEYEKQFTADVAHELRTPLAGMRLNIELMDEAPEKLLLLNRIDDLLVTIERLLQFARASHELHSDQAYSFNVQDDVIEPLKAEYEGSFPHQLHWNVPRDLFLKGDPSLIYLLMKNLLDNAKFYAASGKETTVIFQELPHNIVLTISDNGEGIPSEQLIDMTKLYKRADQTRQGFGLGLNMVERIVHAHDAKMTIENRSDGQSGLMITIVFKR